MCCKCCSTFQRKLWVFSIGTFILIIGLIIGILWPTLSTRILNEQLELKEGSMNYDNWKETPIPMYFDVYLFNWTNPDDIDKEDYKPHFVEYGPLVFTEKHTRDNIIWNSNHTVSFYQTRQWHFVPEMSKGNLKEPITAANVITATVAHMMKDKNKIMKRIINYILNNKGGSLYWTKPAGEWLFDGFDDELLTFLKTLNSSAVDIPFSKFGWLVDRNNNPTYDGYFNMYTGTDDIDKLGYIAQWKYSPRTDYYQKDCGIVKGTSGELWPPSIDTNKYVSVFATDICRYVNLYPIGDYEVEGVSGNIWKPSKLTLDNGDESTDNKCFCPVGDECPKNGVIDVSKCRFGAPVSFSFPHFYMADPSYLAGVDGIKPEKNKHEFFMALEPTMGIPLEVSAKFQINMKLRKIEGFDIYKKVQKEVMMPMFWFNQRAKLDESNASKAKLALALPIIGIAAGYTLAGIGGIIIIIGIFLTIFKKWGGSDIDDRQPLSNDYNNQNN